MADTPDNRVLEHLRAIRATLGNMARELGDVRHRVSSIERHLGCEHDWTHDPLASAPSSLLTQTHEETGSSAVYPSNRSLFSASTALEDCLSDGIFPAAITPRIPSSADVSNPRSLP